MANKREEYESKAIVNSIKFTSRASVCIVTKSGDKNFYTVESCEERIIPNIDGVDIAKEKKLLWDSVNADVDGQIEDILKIYKK